MVATGMSAVVAVGATSTHGGASVITTGMAGVAEGATRCPPPAAAAAGGHTVGDRLTTSVACCPLTDACGTTMSRNAVGLDRFTVYGSPTHSVRVPATAGWWRGVACSGNGCGIACRGKSVTYPARCHRCLVQLQPRARRRAAAGRGATW